MLGPPRRGGAPGSRRQAAGALCREPGNPATRENPALRLAPQMAEVGGRLVVTFTARNLSSCHAGHKPHVCRSCYWAQLEALPSADDGAPCAAC